MSSRRPFNTSKKAPSSTMLKGFSTDRNVTRQLEIDSRRMEEKLTQLKVTMNREKQERQAQGRDNIWASGKANGSLTTEAKKKTKPGPQRPSRPADKNKVRRIKVLKDVPLDVPERPKVTNGLSAGDSMSPKRNMKGPVCGQCEAKPVSLTCMECGENYCTTCFARFHLKGALRNHRSVPYQSSSEHMTRSSWEDANSNNTGVTSGITETPKSSRGSTSHPSPGGQGEVVIVTAQQDTPQGGGSLLEGEYNEEESAASFAAALAEWRNGLKQERGETATNKPEVHDMGVGDTSIQATTDNLGPLEIKFSESSLSYADKLLLKQHHRKSPRITPSPSLNGWSPDSLWNREATLLVDLGRDEADPELDAEMREEHERCVGIFSRNEENHTWMDRPSSQLMITEMKDEPIGGDLEVESVYSVEESQPAAQRQPHGSRCQVVPITGTEEVQEPQPAAIMDPGNQEMGTVTRNNSGWTHGAQVSGSAARDRTNQEDAGAGKRDDRLINSNSATPMKTHSMQGVKQVPGRVISSRKGSRKGQQLGRLEEPGVRPNPAVSGGMRRNQSSSTSGQMETSGGREADSSGKPRSTVEGTPGGLNKSLGPLEGMRKGWAAGPPGRKNNESPMSESQPKKGTPRGMSRGQEPSPRTPRGGGAGSKESFKGQDPRSPRTGSQLEKSAPRGLTVGSSEARAGIVRQSKTPSSHPREGPSRGLTKTSSEELRRVVKQGVQKEQHQGFTDGLGGFFMAGMGGQEPEKGGTKREETMTSEEFTFRGPGVWRPSSSLSENLGTVHTPSPPKQTRENSGGSASLRRKKSATKKAKPVDSSIVSWVLSQQPPPPGMEATTHPPRVGGYHGNNNAASGRNSPSRSCGEPRSESRIEIEGDDYARFDEDDGMEGQDEADQGTLEELTWELASQSGRVSADGRITSLSLQEVDPYVENDKFASSLDEELGIRLDDGRGSGLSSPEDQELTLEAVSSENLLETQRDKQAVQDLDDFI